MRGNEKLVFDPGNQFSSNVVPPYCVLPAYWRTFIFHVLKTREVAVYLYLASMCDKHDVAYPSVENMRADLNIGSPTTVASALAQLEHLGFILRRRAVLPRKNRRAHQNVFQRPSAEYTLHRLLQLGLINGDLMPLGAIHDGDEPSLTNSATRHAIKRMLGDHFRTYELLPSGTERTAYLSGHLAQTLAEIRGLATLGTDLRKGLGRRIHERLSDAGKALSNRLSDVFYAHIPRDYANDPIQAQLLTVSMRSIESSLTRSSTYDPKLFLEWLADFTESVDRIRSRAIEYSTERSLDKSRAAAAIEDAFDSYLAVLRSMVGDRAVPETIAVPF